MATTLVNAAYPGIEYPYFKVVGPAADGTFVKMTASDEVTLVDAQGDQAVGVMIETFFPHDYYSQAADEKLRCAVMIGQSVLEFTLWSGTIVTEDDISFDPTDGRPRAAVSGDTIYGKCIQHSDAKIRVLLYGHAAGSVA
jgi:hypothetical protein